MRNFFLGLVLANLAVTAWTRWFSDDPGGVAIARWNEGNIKLVGELNSSMPDPSGSAAAADVSTGAPARVPTVAWTTSEPRCVTLGPFRELSQAATTAANLKSGGLNLAQRVAEGDIWVGYWVHLPDLGTRTEADEALSKLRSNGISDSYIVPGGETGHTISLGVFSEIKRAGRRREEVRKLGFDPNVVDRHRRGPVYWVDLTLEPGQELSPDQVQALPGRIIRLEQSSCPGPG